MTSVFSRCAEGKLARWESPADDHNEAIAEVAALGEAKGPILALIIGAPCNQVAPVLVPEVTL